jgi:putative DNA primase/helicase
VASAVCVGQRCPVLSAPRDEDELEKRLGAALIAGQPVISLDNMTIGLDGALLAQVIERPVANVRILGKSELVRIENRASFFATGNNLQILGDLTRRVVLAKLDANMERPEQRTFRSNPFDTVLANRGQYVADALTVVAAYASAGRPDRAPRLASFEGWSDTVRSALIWLGCADPCATMEMARAEDPLLAMLQSLLVSWSEKIGIGAPHDITAAEALNRATGGDEFSEAVTAVASNRGRVDVRTLGKYLSRNKGRIVGGLRLVGGADKHGHSARWWVERNG